ncbi:Uncharacterised protein [uncultured archaeon]|nr:Uncharacterised protein [uncultured archaeon]
MPMKHILLLIAAFALLFALFGCPQQQAAGVPQEQYDALAAQCTKDKAQLQSQLDGAKQALEREQAKVDECVAQKQALDSTIEAKDGEIALLRIDSGILADAREVTSVITEYNKTLEYYYDGYGPGKILNSAKISRIQSQVTLLNSTNLTKAWNALNGCTTVPCTPSFFQDAKAAFVAEMNYSIVRLNADTVAIVIE